MWTYFNTEFSQYSNTIEEAKPDGATIENEIYYRSSGIVDSPGGLLLKLQPIQRISGFVLIGRGVTLDFWEIEKEQYRSEIWFLFLESKMVWVLYVVTLLLFNVDARSFLINHVRGPEDDYHRGHLLSATVLFDSRCDLHRLPGEGRNGHWALLCRIIWSIRTLPSWQCTDSHFRRRQVQIGERLERLLFVFRHAKATRRAEIWVKWEDYRRHGGLLCRLPEKNKFKQMRIY